MDVSGAACAGLEDFLDRAAAVRRAVVRFVAAPLAFRCDFDTGAVCFAADFVFAAVAVRLRVLLALDRFAVERAELLRALVVFFFDVEVERPLDPLDERLAVRLLLRPAVDRFVVPPVVRRRVVFLVVVFLRLISSRFDLHGAQRLAAGVFVSL